MKIHAWREGNHNFEREVGIFDFLKILIWAYSNHVKARMHDSLPVKVLLI